MGTETIDQPPPADADQDDDDDDDGMFYIVCHDCGIEFGVPDRWDDARRSDGRTFFCPNGHGMAYSEPTDKKLAAAQAEATRLKHRNEHLEAKLEGRGWFGLKKP